MADQLLAAGDRCFADEAFDEAVEKYSEVNI